MKLNSFFLKWIIVILFSVPGVVFGKNILVIESYHSEYKWDASYKKGIENILGKKHKIRYFQMDTKRVPKSEYEKRADLAWNEYLKTGPDLVILGDDNALKYLCARFGKTKTPVVFLGVNSNPRLYNVREKKNITGVLERPLLKRSILYLKDILKPSPKKVLILFDSGTTSHILLEEQFNAKFSLTLGDVNVELKLIQRLETWKASVKNAKREGYNMMIVGLYHTIVDKNGTYVESESVLKWTDANSPIPMFGFWDFSVGVGKTIGGLVLFGREQGEEAGKLVEKIFQGENPGQIFPVTARKGKLLFSRSQLKKWGIQLPGSIASEAEFVE